MPTMSTHPVYSATTNFSELFLYAPPSQSPATSLPPPIALEFPSIMQYDAPTPIQNNTRAAATLNATSNEEEQLENPNFTAFVYRDPPASMHTNNTAPKPSQARMSSTHSTHARGMQNVFEHIMPQNIPNRLVSSKTAHLYSVNHQQAPTQKNDPCAISIRQTDIASVEWAGSYPGCKLFIKLTPDTLPNAQHYRAISHVVLLTKGDKINFEGQDPTFQYELTRLLLLTGDKAHVEIFAFNKNGEYFTEASNVFFPCVLEMPAHLIDPHAFGLTCNSNSKPSLRRSYRFNPLVSTTGKAPAAPAKPTEGAKVVKKTSKPARVTAHSGPPYAFG